MTDRSVRSQIDILKQMGLIEVIARQRSNGSQTSNAYRLMLSDEGGRKNLPAPMEKNSSAPRKNLPTRNLGTINRGNEPTISRENALDGPRACDSKSATPKKRAASKSRMREDWTPGEKAWTWAVEFWGDESRAARELEEFRDYWIGVGKMMANWDATFRNGMRKRAQWESERKTKAAPSRMACSGGNAEPAW